MGNVGKWALALAVCGAACAGGGGPGQSGGGNVKVDAGTPDAGPTVDGGTDAGADAGPPDAGPIDGGTPDAGPTFGSQGPWPVENVQYGYKDGIQEMPVVGVTTDETQNLWVATRSALYLLKPGDKAFKRFDVKDGLHLPGNPVEYCDRDFAGGDRSCPIYGEAGSPGITEIVGGGPNEVFVGYAGQHNWNDPNDGEWGDPLRHSGKLDRVRLNSNATLEVVRFDMVSGNSVQFWHNRTVNRMVYDHFIHKHELYVGAEHGVIKLSPDLWFPPNKSWPYRDYLYWMSDHLHPVTCFHQQCTGNEGRDSQRMGDWRGLAISPEGDLWVGGKWSAGKIFYTPLNAELKPDGTPNGEGKTGWFQRGGNAFDDPETERSYAFGFDFCGTNGIRDVWNGSAWQTQSCSPYSGTPPVFWPPSPGEPVSISAVTVTPDGVSWWASAPPGSDPAYGLASFDDKAFKYYDPIRDAGMAEYNVADLLALPDGRLVLAGPGTGLTFWDPKTGKHTSLRAGQGIPDDRVLRLQLDTMVDPPALQVATEGGAAVLRVLR